MQRKLQKIDASGQVVGRLATRVATFLIGKHKPGWRPNVDSGDVVEVRNIAELRFTGKKLEQKQYYHYSGYPGGMKIRRAAILVKTQPEALLRMAVKRMLPKNTHLVSRMKRLHIA